MRAMWHAGLGKPNRGLALVLCAVLSGPAAAQVGDTRSLSSGEPYVLDRGYFKLPAGRKIGSTAGIAIDPDR
jgi:hypothetical protein